MFINAGRLETDRAGECGVGNVICILILLVIYGSGFLSVSPDRKLFFYQT